MYKTFDLLTIYLTVKTSIGGSVVISRNLWYCRMTKSRRLPSEASIWRVRDLRDRNSFYS